MRSPTSRRFALTPRMPRTFVAIAALALAGSPLPVTVRAQGTPAATAAPSCPAGTRPRLDPATQRLRCERRTPVFKDATCDPDHAEFVVYRPIRGRDVCVRTEDAGLPPAELTAASPRTRPVRCLSEVRLDLDWQLETDRDQLRDRCRAERVEWIDPTPPNP